MIITYSKMCSGYEIYVQLDLDWLHKAVQLCCPLDTLPKRLLYLIWVSLELGDIKPG